MRCSTAARRAPASPRPTAQQVRISRAMGYVADIFDGETLSRAAGPMAIGHVRYSTAGESKLLNAQPILIDCAHGQIAICHNGNLVNARELRDELVRQGSIFQSSSDTEVVLHLYARSKARSVEDAIVESVSQVQGAFSLVMLTQGSADRGPRSARLPAARARPARRRVRRLLGNVRDGSDRRDLRARRRAGRDADHLRRRHAVDQAVSAGAARALRLRARLLRAARQLRVRPAASTKCAPSSAGCSRASSRSTPTSSCRCPTRACARRWAIAEESGIPLRMGLIRNHYVGRTFIQPQSVDPPLRREGEAESGAEHPRRQARGPGRRLDRARHDQPQDREDGARRGREGSARAHQLSADDLAVLLRRRHAAASRS